MIKYLNKFIMLSTRSTTTWLSKSMIQVFRGRLLSLFYSIEILYSAGMLVTLERFSTAKIKSKIVLESLPCQRTINLV